MASDSREEKKAMKRDVNDLPLTTTLIMDEIINHLLGPGRALTAIKKSHLPEMSTRLPEIGIGESVNRARGGSDIVPGKGGDPDKI